MNKLRKWNKDSLFCSSEEITGKEETGLLIVSMLQTALALKRSLPNSLAGHTCEFL